jgi:hypothetical protein
MSPFHPKQVLTPTFEKTLVARPKRLSRQIPLRYRIKGLGRWHEGVVENLSHTGVLFSGQQHLSEYTLVEMVLEMPEEISGQMNSMVLCQGRIVRRTNVRELIGTAASILDYKVLPPRSAKV